MAQCATTGVQSERPGTALRLADLAIQVCESIPITDKKKQKWLVEGVERLRMSKAKISQENSMREDWVTPEEYAPRRPWNGIEQRGTTFPLFGREIKASAGVVVVMDLSGIDAGERSQTLNGLRLAVNESGQDVEMRVVVVGREIVVWPERAATSALDDKGRKTLLDWIEQLDQGSPHSSSSTRGKLASAIKEAHAVRGAAGTPPSSILVICQESDLEDFNPDQLAHDIPIHTSAIPRLGNSGWSGQKAQIEKMRILAEMTKATFTVVSDDWTWLYLGA